MITQSKDGEIEIDLLGIVRVLWKNAIAILLVAAIFGAAAFGYTFLMVKPTYEATASLYVNNSSFTFGSTSFSLSSSEISAANSLVSTYIFILESRTTLEEVIEQTGVDYTYEEMLEDVIKTESVSGTAAFTVTVTSNSPSEAELIANTIAKILPDRIAEIVDGTSVRIVDYAIVPSHRASPSYTKNTAIGVLLGVVLACAWVVVSALITESRNVVISSSEELRELYPDIPVLSLIPDMRLTGKKGYYYSSYYGEDGKTGKSRKNGKIGTGGKDAV